MLYACQEIFCAEDMILAAFPIVYQEGRGWDAGLGGLSFLGVAIGMLFTIPFNIYMNKRYGKISDQYGGFAPPEHRLLVCMAGAITAPIGLFWVSLRSFTSSIVERLQC